MEANTSTPQTDKPVTMEFGDDGVDKTTGEDTGVTDEVMADACREVQERTKSYLASKEKTKGEKELLDQANSNLYELARKRFLPKRSKVLPW